VLYREDLLAGLRLGPRQMATPFKNGKG
jgi:hypothetical protein